MNNPGFKMPKGPLGGPVAQLVAKLVREALGYAIDDARSPVHRKLADDLDRLLAVREEPLATPPLRPLAVWSACGEITRELRGKGRAPALKKCSRPGRYDGRCYSHRVKAPAEGP